MFVDRKVTIYNQKQLAHIEDNYAAVMNAYRWGRHYVSSSDTHQMHADYVSNHVLLPTAKTADEWGKLHNQAIAQIRYLRKTGPDGKPLVQRAKLDPRNFTDYYKSLIPREYQEYYFMLCRSIKSQTNHYAQNNNGSTARTESIGRLKAKIAELDVNQGLNFKDKFEALSTQLITELNFTEADHNKPGCKNWFSRNVTRSNLAECYMKILRENYINPGSYVAPKPNNQPAVTATATARVDCNTRLLNQ